MNNYPVWWDSTITIYNKFEDPQTNLITWFRTVLTDCFWKNISEKVTVGEIMLDTNSIICRIPKNDAYRDKSEWVKIPNDEMGNYFTIGIGDIIIKGDVEDEINEYVSGKRSTDLLGKYKKYGECLVIENCANNTGPGRGNEHYRAKGV